MRVLDSKKIKYNSFTYLDSGVVSGIEVARVIGQNPDMVFKTLVTEGASKKNYVFLVPVEKELDLSNETSQKYEPLVKEADTMRILYASYHKKRRDSLLKVIKEKLLILKKTEEILLTELVKRWEETK